jgi:hypothetical protein
MEESQVRWCTDMQLQKVTALGIAPDDWFQRHSENIKCIVRLETLGKSASTHKLLADMRTGHNRLTAVNI